MNIVIQPDAIKQVRSDDAYSRVRYPVGRYHVVQLRPVVLLLVEFFPKLHMWFTRKLWWFGNSSNIERITKWRINVFNRKWIPNVVGISIWDSLQISAKTLRVTELLDATVRARDIVEFITKTRHSARANLRLAHLNLSSNIGRISCRIYEPYTYCTYEVYQQTMGHNLRGSLAISR